jgi:hypothetical protein
VKRTLILLLVAFPLLAQERNSANYERLLIPVLTGVLPGAYGSLWQTTLLLRNDGDTTLDAFPLSSDCLTSIGCYRSVRSAPAFHPHQTGYHYSPYQLGPFGTKGSATGSFLYVERGRIAQLSARLAVSDVSRTPAGSTEIPLVPESEFFDMPRSILGVPLVPAMRVSLRVYTADERPDTTATVRIHELLPRPSPVPPYIDGPALLAERTFTFVHDAADDNCGFFTLGCPPGVRYLPSTIVIGNLLDAFPELATAREQPRGLRIEIEPVTPGLRYWPLVTATRDVDGFVSAFTVR